MFFVLLLLLQPCDYYCYLVVKVFLAVVSVATCSFLSSAVRYGRVPKRSSSGEDQAVSTTEPMEGGGGQPKVENVVAAAENRQMAIYDVIRSISHSHTAHCSETEDKVMALQKFSVSLVSSSILSLVSSSLPSLFSFSLPSLVISSLPSLVSSSLPSLVSSSLPSLVKLIHSFKFDATVCIFVLLHKEHRLTNRNSSTWSMRYIKH